mgnify:CR=1 FL=1|tara:strand:+ start:997 stop:1482 length:486 start_codon:yes stop_codon:yes gene_type:complete
MKKINIFFGIFIALAISRFIPHPPNFTSLIALSFYVPAIFGIRYLPALLISFVITDYVIGFHNTVFFTWGSVILISLLSKYFINTIFTRIIGALSGAVVFFIITNFGVWITGMYETSLNGLIQSYVMGLPFFGYSLISTFIFSSIVETVCYFFKLIPKNIN